MKVSIIVIALLVFMVFCAIVAAIATSKKRQLSKKNDKIHGVRDNNNNNNNKELPNQLKLNSHNSGTASMTHTLRKSTVHDGQEGEARIENEHSKYGVTNDVQDELLNRNLSLANQDSLVIDNVGMEGKKEGIELNETMMIETNIVDNVEIIDDNIEMQNANDVSNFDEKLNDDVGVENAIIDDIVHHIETQE